MAFSRSRLVALVAGVCLGLGVHALGPAISTAHAQMRMMMGGARGMGGGGPINVADIAQYGKILSLDETQAATVSDLHAAYQADYEKAQKSMNDGFERLRAEFEDSRDPSIFQKESPAIIEKFQARTEELEKTFLSDMKSLLTQEQSTRWASVERANRRNRSLPGGMLSGESMDLVKVLSAMEMPAAPDGVTQAMERYETELDAAIQERDAKRTDLGKQMQDLGRGGGGFMNMDIDKMQKLFAEMRKSGLKVRDINDRFATVIQNALPEDQRARFGERVRNEKFPNIFRESHAMRSLKAASEFGDLPSESKQQIADMITRYEREAQPLNDRWARLTADAEKDGGGDDMMQGWMRMARGGGDDEGDKSELAETRRSRRKLDSDTLEKLKAMLNEDQIERLPRRESAFQGFGGGRR